MTGVHRDTIMRLGVRIGEGCAKIMDEKMRNLPCRVVQVDEIWGFVQMKEKTAKLKRLNSDARDVWTWIALDAETKTGSSLRYWRPDAIHGEHLH